MKDLTNYKYGDFMKNEMVQLYIESEFSLLKSNSSKVVSIILDFAKEEVKGQYKKGAHCKSGINKTIIKKLDYLIFNSNVEISKELSKLQFNHYFY